MIYIYYAPLDEEGEEHESQTTSVVSTSLLWKFLWQPQAAQVSAAVVPSSPLAMNSLQPSTAYPPTPAAWFFWHSPYLTLRTAAADELLEASSDLLTTTCRFLMMMMIIFF